MDIYRSTKVIHSQILKYILREKFARVLKNLKFKGLCSEN